MSLSFFTNSAGSYGSAVPFQRIVEPAQLGFFLNLEQAELLRIQRYNEGWRFYYGRHWSFKREDGEPLVTINYVRKLIDKGVSFLVEKGFGIRVPEALEELTKPFLDEVWEYNKKDQFAYELATMGSVTGDAFVMVTYETPSQMQMRINPYSQGRIRLNLLGSEQCFPTWDPLNTDALIAMRIETIYYAERGTRALDREDRASHEGRTLNTKRFTQIITRDQIVEQYHGDMPTIRPNVLGEIPIVHIKNLPVPKEYYGLPDTMDILDLQRELNEKSTDISDTINYHAAPVTIIFGAKAKQLDRSPRQIWSGLPADARVETLKLEGDLVAANSYWDKIKKSLHELSDVPEGTLGSMQPVSNTSGVALHMQYEPLIERTLRKKAMYQPGIQQINYFILRVALQQGLMNLPFDLCKSCGGRIIEVATGEMTKVWDNDQQRYVPTPVRKKKCYHIDKQTLDFTDPFKMRLKFWRQYGFGSELKELPYDEIVKEMAAGKSSFWDYTVLQKALLEKWHQDNPQPEPETPTPATYDEMGNPNPQAPPSPQRQVQPPPPLTPPPQLQTKAIPDKDIDIPEEPERVEMRRVWSHPVTGEIVETEVINQFLVPTGCYRPQYLNPFENEVEFHDALPKDEALEAQLFLMYQQAGWVDAEWCQDNIPRIANSKMEINRRKKAQPQDPTQDPNADQQPPKNGYTDNSPNPEKPGQVPGQGGNPTDVTKQFNRR